MNVITSQEVNLIKYHINAIKQVMRDIVSYGVRWLTGPDRETQANSIKKLNQMLLRYENFINSLNPPTSWVNLYEILLKTGAQPYSDIYNCLDGLERLTNHITDSMNATCANTTYSNLPLECANATIRHRLLKEALLSISSDILGCKRRIPDTLIFVTYDMLNKIDFYKLQPIDKLGETIKLYSQVCLITRTIDG